jgi:hypothetical protein
MATVPSVPDIIPDEVEDDETLTQYGNVRQSGFHTAPWRAAVSSLSLVRGRRTIMEMTRIVRKEPPREGDAVRWTTAGHLRAHGFSVLHTPNLRNRSHISVKPPEVWDDTTRSLFDGCFEPGMVWTDE